MNPKLIKKIVKAYSLDPDIVATIEKMAIALDVTSSKMVNEILKEYIKEHRDVREKD